MSLVALLNVIVLNSAREPSYDPSSKDNIKNP